MSPANPLLLLTGSVNPDGMIFTRLQDPVMRQQQYIESIRFYLKKTSYPVLFVENSGHDMQEEFGDEIDSGRLEYLSWNGNNYDKQLGKGYGEMLIIQHAIANSKLINESDFIFKVTGRYKILNIRQILKSCLRLESEIVADTFSYSPYCDSRFWGATKEFYTDILIKQKDQINDSAGVYFEHVLYNAIKEAITKKYHYGQLPDLPRYAGVYGTENTKMKSGWLYWYLKSIKRRYKKLLADFRNN